MTRPAKRDKLKTSCKERRDPVKLRKIVLIPVAAVLVLAALAALIYPNIEFRKDGRLYVCRFSGDFSEFEENASYNELYFYNEKRDISLHHFDVKNFLCFYVLSFDYVAGDFRQTQFVLEEGYITHWLEAARIEENPENIDLAALIEGKTAVVGNTRYPGNEYDKGITYELDGKWEELYVYECDGMTVIQVGSPDELPKFIAYR